MLDLTERKELAKLIFWIFMRKNLFCFLKHERTQLGSDLGIAIVIIPFMVDNPLPRMLL
jgi:hypothetical protein